MRSFIRPLSAALCMTAGRYDDAQRRVNSNSRALNSLAGTGFPALDLFSINPPCYSSIFSHVLGIGANTSGVTKLMKCLGFMHKKPIALAMRADEAEQRKFIERYERLLRSLLPSEIVMHLDAVHPEYQSRLAHGWFQKGQKVAIKTTSGRKRLNLHAAFNLENRDLSIIKADTINAVSFR